MNINPRAYRIFVVEKWHEGYFVERNIFDGPHAAVDSGDKKMEWAMEGNQAYLWEPTNPLEKVER